MEIVLNDKVFVVKNVKARMLRKSIVIKSEVNLYDLSAEELDKLVDFTCEMYENQFTRDELYDGLNANVLLSTLRNVVDVTVEGATDRLATFPTEQ